MDFEQIVTQTVIAFFAVIFLHLAFQVKRVIEKRFRKGRENLKSCREKIREISVKQTILYQKVLYENTNRHHRSIIAASLKQSLDEEMDRLEHIKESMKLVKQRPDLKSSFQQFDTDFFPVFGGVSASVFNSDSRDASGDENKKGLLKVKDRLQTKLCNAWRAQSRRCLQNDSLEVKIESKKNWNDSKAGHIINSQFSQPIEKQVQNPTNFAVNNVSIINFRDHQIKRTKENLDKIAEVKPTENESVVTLPELNSNIVETVQDSLSNYAKTDSVSTRYSKKRSLYSYSDDNNNNNADVNFEYILPATLDDNHKVENQFYAEKGISCRQIRRETKNGKNWSFQFDFIYCKGKEPGVKITIEHKNNKSVINYNALGESLKFVSLNTFQVSPKRSQNNTNTLVRYVVKMSLKVNKKKVVVKCVISSFDKAKGDYKHLNYRTKQQFQSDISCSRVQSKHRLFNRKPHKKRHSLYTNTSPILIEERASKHNDSNYHLEPLAEGDIKLTTSDHKYNGFIRNDIRKYFGNQDIEEDRAILKQCGQFTKDSFVDNSEIFYADVPQLTLSHTQENDVLSTILEEEARVNPEECLEKINANLCNILTFGMENNQLNEGYRLSEKFGRIESVQHIPSFCKESKTYSDKGKVESELQKALNLKASQILEKINTITLRENNSPSHNTVSHAPTSLTCVFELRSFDEAMYIQKIFMNRFYDGFLNKEDYNSEKILRNKQLSSTNYRASCTNIIKKDQNEESQIVEYNKPLYDKINLEKEVLLGNTMSNSLLMEETVFLGSESDGSHSNSQNTSSTVFIMEGAMFSSSDNSTTITWDENESQTDLSDDELSDTSESN